MTIQLENFIGYLLCCVQEHVHEQKSKQQLRLHQLKADERKEKSKKHNEVRNHTSF